jgi:two-component system NtrC family sensor kinase
MNAFSDIGGILTSFFDELPWPALLVDEDGRVTFVNREMRARQRFSAVVLGAPLPALFPEYMRVLSGTPPWLRSQDADITPGHGGQHERVCVRRLPFGACLIVSEPPEMRENEAGGAQTTRLAALGFMVAGVCHEVANPLTAIHSMTQLLQSTRPLPPETLERGLANISANVRRLLNITRKLNDFSRSGNEEKRPLRLEEPIREALQNAQQDALFREIETIHAVNRELWVIADGDQLEQVFANILVNAAQAMAGRGRLWVSSRVPDPLRVEVAIRDTGPGIAPGHLERLFEPFFTTKPSGLGTGLGLAISNEIIIEHGGSLRAENHPAGGACFYVSLPLRQCNP